MASLYFSTISSGDRQNFDVCFGREGSKPTGREFELLDGLLRTLLGFIFVPGQLSLPPTPKLEYLCSTLFRKRWG